MVQRSDSKNEIVDNHEHHYVPSGYVYVDGKGFFMVYRCRCGDEKMEKA